MRFSHVHLSLRRFVAIVFVACIALFVGALASGRIGYVVTNGVSMQPAYHAGDLVVLVSAGNYANGDVVAYHGGQDARVEILHRIIGGDDNGYVIKGDNNSSIDSTRPRASQIIGREAVHIPQIGAIVASPLTHALVLLAALVLVVALVRKPAPRPGAAHGSRRASDRSTTAWKTFVALDLVLLAAVGATFGLASHPAHRSPPTFTQTGVLTYQARPPRSDTYPTGRINTGDPVYLKLLHILGVSYHFTTDAPTTSVRGTIQLDAALSTPSGWHTTIPLVARTPLAAGVADVTANLDLSRLGNLQRSVGQATGVGDEVITVGVTAATTVTVGTARAVTSTSVLALQLTALEVIPTGDKLSPSPHGPALVSKIAINPPAPTAPHHTNGWSHTIRFALIALLLLSLAATAVVWPAPIHNDDPARARTRISAVGIRLADSTAQIQVADRATLAQIALDTGLTLVEKEDGWVGIFDHNTVYWATTNDPRSD